MSDANDVIDRYERGGQVLTQAIEGLTPDQGRERIGPGEWSISEVVAHMLDSDLVGIERMKRVIAEDNPTLQAYDENAWIDRLDSRSMPMAEAAALFAANRKWMARVLRNVADADFARSGLHTEDGPKTLAKLLAGYVNHLDHHLRFLYGKRGALGAGIAPRYSQD
ncbi:MAG TPA: DinB family protein [Isosphaeraceae bacterium]|jgi:uncharacterized damage-inducible protein DinB